MNFDSEFFSSCIAFAQQESAGSPVSPTTTAVGDFNLPKTKGIPEDIPQFPLISDSYPGAFSDFYGFPSHPICIYRTGDEWPVPKGPQAQRVPREARPICNHPIRAVWHTLGEQVYKFLDSLEVLWSTIDPVRFAEEGGEAGPPSISGWVSNLGPFPSRLPRLQLLAARRSSLPLSSLTSRLHLGSPSSPGPQAHAFSTVSPP